MHRKIEIIASNRFLNVEKFKNFCNEKCSEECNNGFISSWYISDVVKKYKDAGFNERIIPTIIT